MEIEQLYGLFLESKGVTTDTRTLSGGEMFFALKGETFDGNAYIVVTLTKYNLKTGNKTTVDKTVCRVSDLDVVVGSEYSSSSHVFKNSIKGVKVIGEPTAKNAATVFTATSHSAEHGGS